jgi:hypothetical protein
MQGTSGKLLVQESHLLRDSKSGYKCIAGEGFYGEAFEVQPTPISFVGEARDSKWTLALTLVPNCAANLEQALVSFSLR